jgi:hypothetical protein
VLEDGWDLALNKNMHPFRANVGGGAEHIPQGMLRLRLPHAEKIPFPLEQWGANPRWVIPFHFRIENKLIRHKLFRFVCECV